jgi:hypothetical protein
MIADDNGWTGQSVYIRLDLDCTGSAFAIDARRVCNQIKQLIAEARFRHEIAQAEKILKEATATVKRARTGAWQKPPDFSRPPRKLRNTGRNR